MKLRTLILAALIAAPLPALAANDTITITLTTQAAGCSAGCTKVLNAPAGANLLALIISTYQGQCNATNGTVCTAGQVIGYWAGTVGSDLRDAIQNAQTAAAAAAVNPVPVQ